MNKHVKISEQSTSSAETPDKKSIKPEEKKLNVLFIGDADTDFPSSYARDILNSGLVTGDVVSTQGDVVQLFNLMQTNLNDDYDIVSVMFSNSVPDAKTDTIEILKVMFNNVIKSGAKLITISPPTKEFAPYGYVKYPNTEEIATWMNTESDANYNIDAFNLTRNKIFFQKNRLLLNREGHLMIAKRWLAFLAKLQPENKNSIIKKASRIKDSDKLDKNGKSSFKMGDKSPKIMLIQRRLRSLEYKLDTNESKIGEFGKSTYNAVKMFQLINELPVTGEIDAQTARTILNSSAKSFSKWGAMFTKAPDFIKKLGLDAQDADTAATITRSVASAAAAPASLGSSARASTSKNGKLSASELKSIGGNNRLIPKAADAFLEMEKAAKEDGVIFDVTDSYRTYEVQDAKFDWERYNETGEKKKRGTNIAMAYPGTSNHGWGKAIDVFPKKAQDWIKQNGEKYGWSWAEGRSVGEDWHFTYVE